MPNLLTSGPGGTRSQVEAAEGVVAADLAAVVASAAEAFDALAGDHVLMTGGAGFLGYELVQAVVRFNDANPTRRIRLTVLDNFVRGVPEWLTSLEGAPGLELRRHDVVQPLPGDLEDPDWMIHGASIASPIYYRKHPLETMDANVEGLRRLLERARFQLEERDGIKGVLFFSTSEIYGDPTPENIPTPETYRGNVSCTGPRACYDESKRFGETLAVTYAGQFGVPVRTVRPFNNYGPGLKITDRRVIPDFARDILSGRDVVLLSDGTPTRTFCYVSDAVAGYLRALVHGRNGEAYNIGTDGPEVSMRELAHRLATVAGDVLDYRGSVTFANPEDEHYLTDNPVRRCPVIDKARQELGYAPSVGLDEGLGRSLIWYAGHSTGADA